MGVFTFEDQTTSVVAPARLFKALAKDADNILPKAIDTFKGAEIVEGNGGPGTIKKITFVEDGETKHVLHKIEGIDEANFVYKYSIVGGTGFPETVEKISHEAQLSAGPNGGSIGTLKVTSYTKTDVPPTEEEIKIGKAKGDFLFKAIEGYVIANPDYN